MKKPKVISTTKTVSPTAAKEDDIYGPDDPAEEADAAFIESQAHALDELELQPFNSTRSWAADSMTLHYGRVDEAGMEHFRKNNIYPGAVSDVGIVLWLCSLKDRTEIDKARRDPVSGAEKAAAWAREHGIDSAQSDRFWKAFPIFIKIMTEWRESITIPESSGNGSSSPNE